MKTRKIRVQTRSGHKKSYILVTISSLSRPVKREDLYFPVEELYDTPALILKDKREDGW